MPIENKNIDEVHIQSDVINPTLIAQLASKLYTEIPGSTFVPKHETEVINTPAVVQNTSLTGVDYVSNITAKDSDFVEYLNLEAFSALFPQLGKIEQPEESAQIPDITSETNAQQEAIKPKCFAQQAFELFQYNPVEYDFSSILGVQKSILGIQPLGIELPKITAPEIVSEPQAVINQILEDYNFSSVLSAFKGITNNSTLGFEIPNFNLGKTNEPSVSQIKIEESKAPEPELQIEKRNTFDVNQIRKDFPVLHQNIHGKPLVWFDNGATTQKPQSVIDAISRFYETDNSNIHRGAHTLAARATDAYENARDKVRRFLGAGSSTEIIFVRGTTEGINLVAQTYGRKFLQPGDEIILTILDHHANIVPWQMIAKERGAIIRVVNVNDKGEILLDDYSRLLNTKTKLVAMPHANNSLGTIVPVKEMTDLAHKFGAHVLIDGAQTVAHIPVNLQELGADFYVFSGHKVFSPTGIGVVYGRREILDLMPPWQGGGNMIQNVTFEETTFNPAPAKFEAGTPNIADAVGLGAALDYVSRIGLQNIARYEHELTKYGTEQLLRVPDLRLVGTAREKVAVLSFVLKDIPVEEVGKLLDQEGIAVRAGHHCAQPSLRRFGLNATVRPSLSLYNTKEEIDRLVAALLKIVRR